MRKENFTSIEKRRERIDFALTINALDGAEPSKEGMELLEDYINGKESLEENIARLKAMYREKIASNKK